MSLEIPEYYIPARPNGTDENDEAKISLTLFARIAVSRPQAPVLGSLVDDEVQQRVFALRANNSVAGAAALAQ